MNPVTEKLGSAEFTILETVKDESGKSWRVGMLKTAFEGHGIYRAMAREDGQRTGYSLEIDSISEEGKWEGYRLASRFASGLHAGATLDAVPPSVLKRLEHIANDKQCFGMADFRQFSEEMVKRSVPYSVYIDKEHWIIAGQKVGEHYVAFARHRTGENEQQCVALTIQELSAEGKIARADQRVMSYHDDGGIKESWRNTKPEDKIPERLIQELHRFSNHFKLFGEMSAEYQQQSERVVSDAMDKGLDREMAELMKSHYQSKIDDQLDRVNETKPADDQWKSEISRFAGLQKEAAHAAKLLAKPAKHSDRITYEGKMRDATDKSPDTVGKSR